MILAFTSRIVICDSIYYNVMLCETDCRVNHLYNMTTFLNIYQNLSSLAGFCRFVLGTRRNLSPLLKLLCTQMRN